MPTVLASEVVGRDRELAALRAAVASATDGSGGVLFVVGEAGIGKSRLVGTATAEAEGHGARGLRGRAVPTATPVAYRPLAEALSSAVRAGDVVDPPELAPFRATLSRLIPDWRTSDGPEVDDAEFVLAEGVVRFLRAATAARPCVLVLEDLHWADPETLAIVEYLADNLRNERVLCVATARDESPSAGLELVRSLHARRASAVVELHRLGDGDVGAMVASCLGTEQAPTDLVGLAGRADGVPFLVEELLAEAVAAGALVHDGRSWTRSGATGHAVPLTFADSVRRRLATLGPDGRTVLGVAAILGRRFDWELLPGIADLDEATVVAALQAAIDVQLVAVDAAGGGFHFRHALSRDAVLAELLPPLRVRLCRRALEVVEASHPGLPGAWCVLAAGIAEGADDRVRAALLHLEAGRRALDAGALTTAESTFERARALSSPGDPVTADVEEGLLTVLALAGKHDRAVEVGESLVRRLGRDPEAAARRAEAQLRIAQAAVAATQWADADVRLELAATELAGVHDDVHDDGLRARIDVVAAHAAILRRPAQAVVLARAALEAAERLDLPEVACEALEIVGRFERARRLDVAEEAFTRALHIAEGRGRAVWTMRALHELGTIDLLREGELGRLERARELAVSLGALATTAVIDVQLGSILSMYDDPEPGAEVCRRAAAVARRHRLDEALAAALLFEGVVHARAGRRAEVERCVAEAVERAGDTPEVRFNRAFVRANLAWVLEDRPAAVAALAAGTVPAEEAVGVQSTGPNPALLALLLAVDGDDAGAARWSSQPSIHFLARGYAHYAAATLAGRSGDGVAALAELVRGDAELGAFNWYRHYGRRLVAEAAVEDGWGDPAAWLLDALAFFEARGDRTIASACRSLLRRAGAAVPRRRGAPAIQASLAALGVTAREAEVLRLLADGLSNHQIGTRLYMSPRTVERHVASLTVKAAVDRRAQLVAFAVRAVAETP